MRGENHHHQQQQKQNLNLETHAEKLIGKEINVIEKRDFNHLDLIIEAKNNRLKAEFFYIYDYEKFNNCSLLKPDFNIFGKSEQNENHGINHTSSRYIIHYLTKELKKRLYDIIGKDSKSETNSKNSKIYDIFKPSLGQFDDKDIIKSNEFIKSMFPYEGCSYTGSKLESIVQDADWIILVLSLRIIWSLLPGAILTWDSFDQFNTYERSKNYEDFNSFYSKLPLFLPSHNHACILFEFLEIFIIIFKDNYFINFNTAIDLIFTAGQICFNRDAFETRFTHNNSNNNNLNTIAGHDNIQIDDLHDLQKFYYRRGYAFHQVFVSYLRGLSTESSVIFKHLFDLFKIDQYPPTTYKPLTQKALTLTVPHDDELNETNYFKLISMAANATSRIYSSNYSFTKFENKFLDKFEINPYKIIENFFSKSSKNYLLKFDKTLDFDDFKIENHEFIELRKNLKEGTAFFENSDFISTFMNDFGRNGFNQNNENFMADTINFNFNSKMENVDSLPIRVSKLDISEWFINSWKYETFLGYLQNTVILKLTKTIGDCDWLIITSSEKVSKKNRYLTPPSSADQEIDPDKHSELGGSSNIKCNDKEINEPRTPKAFSAKKVLSSPQKKLNRKSPKRSPNKSPKMSLKKKPDLKRISFPSPPQDIKVFEREVLPNPDDKNLKINNDANLIYSQKARNSLVKGSPTTRSSLVPTPTELQIPPLLNSTQETSQRSSAISTPLQQISQTFDHPPQLFQNHDNNSSLPPGFTAPKELPLIEDINSLDLNPSSIRLNTTIKDTKNVGEKEKKSIEKQETEIKRPIQAFHPYNQLRISPQTPNYNVSKHLGSPVIPQSTSKSNHNGLGIVEENSRSPSLSIDVSNSISNKLSKTNKSQTPSPIGQVLPKFFKRTNHARDVSEDSLSFINDSSTLPNPKSQTSAQPNTIINDEFKFKKSENANYDGKLDKRSTSEVENADFENTDADYSKIDSVFESSNRDLESDNSQSDGNDQLTKLNTKFHMEGLLDEIKENMDSGVKTALK
ncbi:hypothetical protein WICMUC_002266 [Wickerhamomyces mucosus]|uniref:Meiotically up-regulated protein Msb1/Mug8 domain-containing protein n=1 Tax=Wickerhamomyces mucosus TaxID=1378264 RepID=A0A9P8PQR5_9ASCO|nr:hypothetical protein WICMUC_002266 [Wickerhamomyces mucosus]